MDINMMHNMTRSGCQRVWARMAYCPRSGFDLLSASFVIVMCQDSKTFLILKFPLSITLPFSKAITLLTCNIYYHFPNCLRAIQIQKAKVEGLNISTD